MNRYLTALKDFWEQRPVFRIVIVLTILVTISLVAFLATYDINGTTGWFGSCVSCPVGSFVDGEGQVLCTECSPGTYAPYEGMQECLKCPDTQFSYEAGQDRCLQCPGDQVSNVDFTGCQVCPPGKYTNSEGECVECEVGSYNTEYGAEQCERCPSGFTTRDSGASTSDACVISE